MDLRYMGESPKSIIYFASRKPFDIVSLPPTYLQTNGVGVLFAGQGHRLHGRGQFLTR